MKKKKRLGSMVPHMLEMLISKTDTILYPAVHARVADRFRGMLRFNSALCIGCKICQRVCPSNAIHIEKIGDKQYKAVVQLDKCIFCGQCVDSCPKNALQNTANFELATSDKSALTVEI